MLDISEHKFILIQILKDIYSHNEIAPIIGFKGGTSCYFFHKLPRFSLDLDFSLLDINKKNLVFKNVKRILQEYGNLKDARMKRFTIFFLLSYGKKTTNIKVEISLRTFPDNYDVLNYLGISMLVMAKKSIMAHKLVALLDRRQIANRDLYDLWYFFKNNWKVNEKIFELRTKKKLSNYLRMCIEEVKKVNNTYILQGLGEVLDDKQKNWVKGNLKNDLIFLMQNYKSFV
jgi:predicted nucleotidyltransferase component of viral defense system